MKKTTRAIGQSGEDRAIQFLKKNGCSILYKNYRYSRYEIDIIAKEENTLLFIEVKYRKNATFGHPEETVSEAQANRIHRAATHYLENQQINPLHPIRFDILAIEANQEVLHFKDAF